jgi:hypothetical protein
MKPQAEKRPVHSNSSIQFHDHDVLLPRCLHPPNEISRRDCRQMPTTPHDASSAQDGTSSTALQR